MAYDEQTFTVSTAHTYTYSPFGEKVTSECYDAPGEADNPFQFTGQWYDAEIGQYYLRARMYDPAMMRFTGRDSNKKRRLQPSALNRYLYCRNNPINYTDINGKYKVSIEGVIEGAGVHRTAVGITAIGAANNNWNLINLGIGIQNLVGDVIDYYSKFSYLTYRPQTVILCGSGINYNSQVYRAQRSALYELAGRAQHEMGQISHQDAMTLQEWANEYGADFRGPEIHEGTAYTYHIHIGPIEHLEIFNMPL